MNNKLQLPFEFTFMPEDGYDFLEVGKNLSVKDTTGIFLCTGGNIDAAIGDKRCHIKENDLLLLVPYSFIHLYEISEDFKGVALHSNLDFFMCEANKILDVKMQLYMMSHLQITLTEDESASILKLMMSIHQRIEIENKNNISEVRRIILTKLIKSLTETLGLELINTFMSKHDFEEPEINRNDEVLRKFIASLNNNYRKERNVAFYAEQQYLSYGYFSRIVREKSGMSAKEWIVRYVTNDAKNMLEHTQDSVKEIADRLNFPNQSFFGKYFKQYVGVSPKDYRSLAAKGMDCTLTK
jgi:AraC family transcriptional regulator, transcriptional activator of pobA